MPIADGSPTCDTTCPTATQAGCANSGYVVESRKPSVPQNLRIGTLIPKNDEYSWTLPISWDPPSDMGTSELKNYKFTISDYYAMYGPDTTIIETGDTSVNITVFYNAYYTFNVSAVTNDGEGPVATTGRYNTPKFAPPCTFEGQRCGAQRWAQ
jgi:hypothetical protein